MKWNWQKPDWPEFRWDQARLVKAEEQFLAESGMFAGNYATITGASPATATRDLGDLVEKGALVREGERRHARYRVAIPLRPVAPVKV